jgi:hypothetical protein
LRTAVAVKNTLKQAPQTRCPRGGPMRPSINFLKSRKDDKMTFLTFFSRKNMIFQFLFIILWQILLNSLLLIAVGYQHNPKNVFLWPAKPRISQMRPASQFEFETPALKHVFAIVLYYYYNILKENTNILKEFINNTLR